MGHASARIAVLEETCPMKKPLCSWPAQDVRQLVDQLVDSFSDGVGINQMEGHDLPDRRRVTRALERLFDLVFPGYFLEGHPVTESNLPYHIGDQVNHILIDLGAEVERAFRFSCKIRQCEDCHVEKEAFDAVSHLLGQLPRIRELLKADVRAGFAGDPAASSVDEVIISYPAIRAIVTHRLAHELHRQGVPLIPRMWSEHAHSLTGIDIHPGAEIGPSFFIDHGTGVVIGETCRIGSHVQIYQGVTLGALAPAKGQSIRGSVRHPKIEDHVTIYAGATILGGETVIGEGCVIGGNVWLTESVLPGTKVLLGKSELVFLRPRDRKHTLQRAEVSCPARELCKADGTLNEQGDVTNPEPGTTEPTP